MRIASWVTFGKFSKFRAVFFKAKTDFADQNDDITKQNIFLKKCEIYFPVGTWRFNRFYFTLFHFVKKCFATIFTEKWVLIFVFNIKFQRQNEKLCFLYNILLKILKYKKYIFLIFEDFRDFSWSPKWPKKNEKGDFASIFKADIKLNIGRGVWKGSRFENEHFSEKIFFVEKRVFPLMMFSIFL